MTVLFPIYSFYPHHGGGPSLSVYWLAKALVMAGVDVTVITSTNGLCGMFPTNQWNSVDGIKVQYCSNKFRLILETLRCIKNTDLIQLSSICYYPSVFIAFWVCAFSKKPIIWSPRGELAKDAILGNKAKKLLFKLYGHLFRKRIVLHGTSEKEIEEIRRFFPEARMILLPNYIELSPKLNNETEHYLMYLGRISPIKSLDKLIKALRISQAFYNSDFKFLVVGKAVTDREFGCERELKDLVKEIGLNQRVVFYGEAGGEKKDELLSKAYCSFLVSETENFGNVVVEAMAQGTPVITSLGTPWSVLKEQNIGYHISNEPSIIAKTIDTILSLPKDAYFDLRNRVYEFCSREYSITDNVSKWIDEYNHLITNSILLI